MAYTAVPSSVYAVGKPITSTAYGYLVDNDAFLKALFDATTGHKHTGAADDAPAIGANGVVQGSLKSTTGNVNTTSTSGVVLTLPGGSYGFRHQFKNSGAGNTSGDIEFATSSTSYITAIALKVSAGTGYAQQRYIQASPPYMLGDIEWGHFLFALVNSSGEIIAGYEAEDPPYAYNGPQQHAKDSIERIAAAPHPFMRYWDIDPSTEGLEIVLFDLREMDTKRWKEDLAKQGKGILEDLAGNVNPAGVVLPPQAFGLPDIPGFTNKVRIRR